MAHDFTITPAAPAVGETVTFEVVNPDPALVYGWDRTLDGKPEGYGPTFSYAYTGPGQKTMQLLVLTEGDVVCKKTLDVHGEGEPVPPNGGGGGGGGGDSDKWMAAASIVLTPNYYAGQDGPDANYQACWMGSPESGVHRFDREAEDRFAIAWMVRLLELPPDGGSWGRELNFHNSNDEQDGVGWSLPNNPPARSPGNSALALDFYSNEFTMNVEDNPEPKSHLLLRGPEMGRRYTWALEGVFGRNDGSTAHPGELHVYRNGDPVLELENVNTCWLFKNSSGSTIIQRYLDLWSGHYTKNLQGGVLRLEVCFPWVGATPAEALAKSGGGTGGPWAISDIPIPGKDHTLGPATYQELNPWTLADAALPAHWIK